MTAKRVAILGISLESNFFAPPTTAADFRQGIFLEGEDFAARLEQTRFAGFTERLRRDHDVEFLPILFYMPESGGPCDQAFFEASLQKIAASLTDTRLDGVFVFGHGAGTTTGGADLDGEVLRTVRQCVGSAVPIVGLLDLHGNVSELMVASADVLIAYRTNPHVDVPERMVEAADLLCRIWSGARPVLRHVKLPMVLPSVTQSTEPGKPYGDLIAFADSFAHAPLMNISVLSGFAFSNVPAAGMSVLVTTDGDGALGGATARLVAQRGWTERHRYVARLTPIGDAVAIAVAAGERGGPVILADVADNPGGGGGANTTGLLAALLAAGSTRTFVGLFHDRAVAAEAHRRGPGARFSVTLNRDVSGPFVQPLAVDAAVVALTDGKMVNTRGVGTGSPYDFGPSALLAIDDLLLAVTSHRRQIFSTDMIEHFGVDPATLRTIVVKSRGHFRAGFDHLVPATNIHEVDAPGLTTPNLTSVPWSGLRRPIFPLDPDMEWQP